MERLTSNADDISYLCNYLNRHSNFDGERFKAIHQKLAEYEDIGLTPDEIKYFLKDFGISLLMENRVLKKQHEEDEEIINKMAKRLKSFEENTFNSGWIPVSERLPSDMQRVSVTLENEMVLEVFYINDKFKFIETFKGGGMEEVYKDNPVIAWQPLPEPYNRRNEIGD